MTSKEFVKTNYPKARAESHNTKRGEKYWLIRPSIHEMYIGVGKTETNAWVRAKECILNSTRDSLIIAGIL